MSAEAARAMDQPDDFLGHMNDLTKIMEEQTKTGEEIMDRGFGNAIVVAANLRLVDAKYKDVNSGDGESFRAVYMALADKDPDFSYLVVAELLLEINTVSRVDGWNLGEMSEDLEKHCLEVIKKQLEKVRGTADYGKVVRTIQSISVRSDTESEEDVFGELKTSQAVIDGLEGMLTEDDKKAGEAAKGRDIVEVPKFQEK